MKDTLKLTTNMTHRWLIFLYIIAGTSLLRSTPLVYNMKIRRVFTGINAFIKRDIKKPVWVVSAVPIYYHRTSHIVNERTRTNLFEKRFGGGSLFNVRYVPDRTWWLEATTAIQKETASAHGSATICGSRTGFDDIVLAGGYNFFPTEKVQISPYALVGFPTRTKVTLQEVEGALVGSRFYGLGFGTEFSYGFITEIPRSFVAISQVRFIHFFTRLWQPILPPCGKIQPGNLTDILLGLRYRHKRTLFEAGYNPTIFTNQAVLLPTEKISAPTSVRHGVYGSITHLLKRVTIANKPIAIGAGFNFNRLPRLDANTILVWVNFTIII